MTEENKDENLGNDSGDLGGSDDDFGLPSVDYKPLEEQEEETSDNYNMDYQEDYEDPDHEEEEEEEEGRSYTGLIVTIIVVLLLGGGGAAGYFFYWVPLQETNKKYDDKIKVADGHFEAKVWPDATTAYTEASKLKPKEAYPKKKISEIEEILAEEKRLADEAAKAAADTVKVEEPQLPPGTVEVLESRDGRFHVVVTSNVDEDLAMDFAKRISEEGKSAKLLKASGKSIYNRVSISDFDTYGEAQTHADGVRGEFANAWVVKF